MKARLSTVPSHSVSASSGGVPHRIGSPVQGREGRAEALGGRVSRSATHQSCVAKRASRGVQQVGAGFKPALPAADRPAKGRETHVGADRRLLLSAAGGRATAREKPEKLIQGRR